METQTCVVIPSEGGCFDVFSSTQWMDHVQHMLADVLKTSVNK